MLLQGVGLQKHFPVTSALGLGAPRAWIKALDGVSVHVAEGETLGIVGESGSGKTTLAKLFLLLERPTGGSLSFDGKDVATFDRHDLARYRRAVQAVFQDPYSSLNPRMRVEQIVSEPLRPEDGMTRAMVRDRVAEALQLVGLRRDSGALYPHEFSGGQRQRIAIARALVTYPKFIVLDEPVSALDVSIRAQILNLLTDLQRRLGVSYLFIAHDLAAVAHMSHTIAVMYLGRIVEIGPASTVALSPRHPSARRERIVLPGEVPNPMKPPAGCRFHPRCPKKLAECETVEPEWREVKPGRFTACHLW